MLRADLLPAGSDRVIEPAWRELERRLRPFVARRVRGDADVDDVVQDVFLRMQRGLGGLRDEERLGPWVYQIARSAIAEHQRTRARHPLARDATASDDGDGDGDGGGVAAPAIDDEDAAIAFAGYLAAFVAALRSPYREALTLTELEGLTQQAAADLLGVSLSGMKSRVQRGRQQLRRALEDCCHIALDARGRVVGYARRPGGAPPEGCCGPAEGAGSGGGCAAGDAGCADGGTDATLRGSR